MKAAQICPLNKSPKIKFLIHSKLIMKALGPALTKCIQRKMQKLFMGSYPWEFWKYSPASIWEFMEINWTLGVI